jgi:hypothetical protein
MKKRARVPEAENERVSGCKPWFPPHCTAWNDGSTDGRWLYSDICTATPQYEFILLRWPNSGLSTAIGIDHCRGTL